MIFLPMQGEFPFHADFFVAPQNADDLFLAGQNFCLVIEQSNLPATDFFFFGASQNELFSLSLSDRFYCGRSFYRFSISSDFFRVLHRMFYL